MKLFLSTTLVLFCLFTHAQVAINTDGTNAHASAVPDLKSTTKGLLIPRVTTAQRTAIASPAHGLMVFDTDYESFSSF